MNVQPVYYLQTDARWKSKPYRVTGESATIGGSGCGPSCAAMLIETLTGKTYTPEDACNWSMAHGYKALNQGTYYSYFKPQFAAFGISCEQLNSVSIYGNASATLHTTVENLLKEGYYIIACMGPGTWTSSGHFVVLWWKDNTMRINDPASTSITRTNGDINTFKKQVKYYWKIDARSYNSKTEQSYTVTSVTGTGTVTATSLYVRTGPSTSYSAIGSLSRGSSVTITGVANGWYRILYNSTTGWVSGDWVTANIVNSTTNPVKEEDDMTGEQIYSALQQYLGTQALPDWAKGELQEAMDMGITDGTNPMQLIPRYQASIMAKRAVEAAIKKISE